MKDTEFWNWESDTFGYGYGTGEQYTLPALRKFFELLKKDSPISSWSYDYEVLERELTPTVAWLLINILCKADIIEYGTSPRHAWITEKGQKIRDYLLSKTEDELYDVTSMSWDEANKEVKD